jgi:hypothetical protein
VLNSDGSITKLDLVGAPSTGPAGFPVALPDGRTMELINDQGPSGTRILIVNPNNTTTPIQINGINKGITYAADGRIFVTTITGPTGAASMTVINTDNTFTTTSLTGTPVGDIVFDADGRGYLTTPNGNRTVVTVYNPDRTTNIINLDEPPDGTVILGTNGTLYQQAQSHGATTNITIIKATTSQ